MELSYLHVHEQHWLCKIVEAHPLPPFIYTVVGWDEHNALTVKYVEEIDPLDPDSEWINDEL